ncbi:phosphonate transport system ATP-binding protein [Nocardioides luteus]|uniref:Phosphate-import ATP-binding protein PhnC n=1 Tax=Nocardioides luteus TaxID=1844 RepID=A0ABQ5T0C9_9ACTN|nr:phosphonate ABC transporter ATP-binding protein [Nocardioides luteus]MDR7310325.1 phosphonate transport system ATP-binding protein [Nocardioides luteus]GGR53439.1 phosphate-import ATP-binding protein PhnC [Nocardioides luteus]GLJ69895.1 phosphate-import ATP-binding protein PhnC [Nocardioides luteus]
MSASATRPENGPSVQLHDVGMSFGHKQVLSDIDLEISPGHFVALVGPSGAGKSTLLRLLNGSHLPTAGRVSVLGSEPATCSRRELQQLRTRIGFVFQQFGLVGRLSAMENVLMGALGSLRMPRYGVSTYPRDLRVRAAENLERVGLLEERFQRCDTLSGGQQQRVAIARTLMQDAEIVLADEPVASLDPSASLSVLETLRRLSAEDGFTVVCSLHQVDLALRISDRIVAVRDGAIVLDRATSQTDETELRSIYSDRAAA